MIANVPATPKWVWNTSGWSPGRSAIPPCSVSYDTAVFVIFPNLTQNLRRRTSADRMNFSSFAESIHESFFRIDKADKTQKL